MPAPPPSVGQVLGHYRIIEQIGAGGMGVVYRARDEQLERDVAIKVLPVGMLADESTRRRFRKEALSLAKLNHPNIATIHEFGSQNGIDFLVTEYIPGVTLDSKLASGALSAKEVIDLGLQLAEGLSAAHQHGVVHRDLKPGNLRITPDGRLKILDFGLAQVAPQSSENTLAVTLSKSQEISGTLPYMAPEQLRGGISDARTDVWGAGAVLYEIATAHRPFEEKVPTALAGDIIHKAPLPPRKLRTELSQNVEAVILKCLEKDPAKRYQSARELQSDMARLSTAGIPLVVRRRWLRPVLATLILVMVGAGALWYWIAHHKEAGLSSTPARLSVAVLGFTNVSGKADASWISTALAEMLTTELAAGEHLRTIPGENVARTKLDLSLPDTDSYGRDTLARIRKNLGADYIILGSYFETENAAGGQMRLDLRLQDAKAGETIATISEMGTETQLLDLVSRTGSELRRKLGVGEVSPTDASAVRASMPSDPEMARLYSEGLKKLRAFDTLGARDALEKAVAHDPGFPLAHSALAEVWSRLGYDKKAKEQAKKAFDLSTNLPREERLSVEARYRDLNHERDKAIDLYRSLFSSAPDNLEYGLQLAVAQQHSGNGKDALSTVESLRHMPPPAGDDPRIDLVEAHSAELLGDFKRAQAAAVSSGKRAQAVGAPLLVAAAQLEQCRIFRSRGQYQDARTACENARNAYSSAGDREELAMALLAIGGTSYEQGDLAEAQKADEQALAVFREIGRESATASTLSELANVLSMRGDHAGAEARYNQALASYRETEDKGNAAAEIHNLASELKLEGKLDDASAKFHESLTVNRELGQEDVVSMDLANLGSALYLQGKLDESARVLEEALVICRRIDFKQACGVALSSQGDLLIGQRKLDEAGKKYKEGLAIRKEMGAAIDAAETQLSIAELALEQGHPREAEAAVREPAEVFRQQQMMEDQVWATIVLAKALIAQGKYLDGQRELEALNGRAAKIQNAEVRLKLALTTASAAAASNRAADGQAAGNIIEAILAEARKHGFVGYELEARLALGKIEMRSAQTAPAGIARLTDLEKDARARGFLLIAQKAASAKAAGATKSPA